MTPAELRRLYDRLPTLECKRLCRASCGPIAMSEGEEKRIKHRLGRPLPHRRVHEREVWMMPPDATCPLLTPEGTCSIYAIRPLICRLWGVVEHMRCPHGCTPEPRYLTQQEGHELLYLAAGWSPAQAALKAAIRTPEQRETERILRGLGGGS